MTNNIPSSGPTLQDVFDTVSASFWGKGDFWISQILAIIGIALAGFGLLYAIKAFREAALAKTAARDAGRIVNYQATTLELISLPTILANPPKKISYFKARDALAAVTPRLRKIISTYEHETDIADKLQSLRKSLDDAQVSLAGVRRTNPTVQETDAPYAVYNAIEGHFAAINAQIGELQGIFEQKTIKYGNDYARTATE